MGKGAWLQRLGLARPAPIGLAEFRERVVDEIRRRTPEAEVTLIGDAEVAIAGGNGTHVGRGYAYYCEQPRELGLVVGQIADGALYKPEPAKPDELIVLVRPDNFNFCAEGLIQPLPGGLIAIVAVDKPERYMFSPGEDLRKQLNMTKPAIWARALDNLRRRLSMAPPTYRDGFLIALKTDIGLASSLLVLDEYWEQPVFTSRGQWIVAPLERDEVVMAPLDDEMAVEALRKIAGSRQGSQFLCDVLLLRRDGAWELFE